jgi:hypothetical protein
MRYKRNDEFMFRGMVMIMIIIIKAKTGIEDKKRIEWSREE